jgi:hypothetical protein
MMSRQRFIEGLEMDSSASWSEIRTEIAWRAEVLGLPKRTPFRELCAAWRMREEDIDLYEQEYGYPMDAPGYTNICSPFRAHVPFPRFCGRRPTSTKPKKTNWLDQIALDTIFPGTRIPHWFPTGADSFVSPTMGGYLGTQLSEDSTKRRPTCISHKAENFTM